MLLSLSLEDLIEDSLLLARSRLYYNRCEMITDRGAWFSPDQTIRHDATPFLLAQKQNRFVPRAQSVRAGSGLGCKSRNGPVVTERCKKIYGFKITREIIMLDGAAAAKG